MKKYFLSLFTNLKRVLNMSSKNVAYTRQIIEENASSIAFIIGNGINLYKRNENVSSWDSLLKKLGENITPKKYGAKPTGISETEFFDILNLANEGEVSLQKEVAKYMADWTPNLHHYEIVRRIEQMNAPLLTTNFDNTLAKAGNYPLQKVKAKGFTDVYPWSSYYSNNRYEYPTGGFGIWHINGMERYHRSIRLGLDQYMGCIDRARPLLVRDGETRSLFSGGSLNNWGGSKTWLQLIFSKSLFVFGLSLHENEVFLRWLLLERKRLYKRFPAEEQKAWYITTDVEVKNRFFLENVGFEIIQVATYEDIYERIWVQ